MRFSFKPILILACLIALYPSHTLLGTEEEPIFLLPKDREDPLKLRPFLQNYAPSLEEIYSEIQTAKATAHTEALLLLKERFCAVSKPEDDWRQLTYQLMQDVKGDPVNLWPGQNFQQCIGSVLFYPQELVNKDDSHLLCYPGLAVSLAISASMGNPVAIYKLSSGYSNLTQECRKKPQDVDQETKIDAQDRRQSVVLKNAALRIFEQAIVTNKIAEFYVMQSAYDEDKIRLEEFATYLRRSDLPQAYFRLGYFYENRRLNAKEHAQNHSNMPDEDQLAYIYYHKALQGGYQEAMWGIHRLLNVLEVGSGDMKALYEKAGGLGLFLAAERYKDELRNFEEAKPLYERSGELGHLYSYITLGNEILLNNIPSDNSLSESVSYYLKADRPGYAAGSRIVSGNPRLCPTDDAKLDVLKRMIQLKDLTGYERALIYMSLKMLSLEDLKTYPTQDLQRDVGNLLIERGKALEMLDSIGACS
jgi:TPR repeat protein